MIITQNITGAQPGFGSVVNTSYGDATSTSIVPTDFLSVALYTFAGVIVLGVVAFGLTKKKKGKL